MLNLFRWIVLSIWVLWLILYWGAGVGLVGNFIRASRKSQFRYDKYFILGLVALSNIMLWTGYFLIKGTVVEPYNSFILTITGLLMVSVGVFMTFWCRRQMRHSWSAHTVVVQNHHLIENGPYRCIRHPIYTFASLMSVGTILVFPVWWNMAAGLGMVVLYVMKSYFEERMLARELSGYLEYRQKVRYRFIPGIW